LKWKDSYNYGPGKIALEQMKKKDIDFVDNPVSYLYYTDNQLFLAQNSGILKLEGQIENKDNKVIMSIF
jgi:hypothetical protein